MERAWAYFLASLFLQELSCAYTRYMLLGEHNILNRERPPFLLVRRAANIFPKSAAYANTVSAYRQYLIGERQLFSLHAKHTSSETPIFIDVNPNIERTAGWQGSLVNDGDVCVSSSEDEVVRYYETSRARKNCVLVPIGPSPLMAYVTTRAVNAGEELLTTYGCEYWVSAAAGATVKLSPRVRTLVRQTAADLRDSALRVTRDYAHDAATLSRMFAELERGGTI